jgi:hypothetical protein
MKTQAACSFEMLVSTCKNTLRHNQKDRNLSNWWREDNNISCEALVSTYPTTIRRQNPEYIKNLHCRQKLRSYSMGQTSESGNRNGVFLTGLLNFSRTTKRLVASVSCQLSWGKLILLSMLCSRLSRLVLWEVVASILNEVIYFQTVKYCGDAAINRPV